MSKVKAFVPKVQNVVLKTYVRELKIFLFAVARFVS